MKKSCRILAGAVFAALIALPCPGVPARAELRIDITSGHVEPMPIAIPAFPGGSPNESQAGRDIAGVVSADLPMAFARDAAYGDLVAAILALLALTALQSKLGIALVWIFNIWGTLDLLNAFYVANATGLSAGQLGAAYFIPTAIVPLLLITHALVFRILLRHDRPTA